MLPSWSAMWIHKVSLFSQYVGLQSSREAMSCVNWPPRCHGKPGDPNILHEPLADRKKIILPRLHIKLGFMKQLLRNTLATDGHCFKYIILQFPGLSMEKIKATEFDGLQTWKPIKDEQFTGTMSDFEKNPWLSFKDVVKNFIGNIRASNYAEIIGNYSETIGELKSTWLQHEY